ncbi:hypothetical protein D9615_007379 [Tricholomella constricta]|uniref:DNA polymerase delta subunit 4 n=1 Tax=Tricholomella constricta TaxID=117010 RepID=A0A8H5LXS8_9AGAR|nr:hypothetical protein D9615_007379 [Tricholomella constricta]
MSSKSSTPSTRTLRQGTLSFGSAKRTATTQNTKPKASQTKKLPALRKTARHDSSEDELDIDDIQVPSSDEEELVEEQPTRKLEERAKTSSKVSKTHKQERQATKPPVTVLQSKNSVEIQSTASLSELNENDPKWRKHYASVREKMGYMHPIHGQGQNKIHEILRVFDLTYEYGPCVGISRLDRWERATALGLNPPPEVKDILTTRQGTEQRELSESVLFNEV